MFREVLSKFSSGKRGVIDCLHMARNYGCRRRLTTNLVHMLLTHDDRAETRDLGVTAVQHHDLGPENGQVAFDVGVEDGVSCEIEALLGRMLEKDTANLSKKVLGGL